MKCKIVKITQLSGNKTSIYSVLINNDNETLFDKFLNENKDLFISEIYDIVQRLKAIGEKTGARIHFFKTNEGVPGDGICALYDVPASNLRLYCIRYGTQIIILGGGGSKSKSIRALQDDKKLKDENYFLRKLSKWITERLNDDIFFSYNGLELEGNLEIEDYEE